MGILRVPSAQPSFLLKREIASDTARPRHDKIAERHRSLL